METIGAYKPLNTYKNAIRTSEPSLKNLGDSISATKIAERSLSAIIRRGRIVYCALDLDPWGLTPI